MPNWLITIEETAIYTRTVTARTGWEARRKGEKDFLSDHGITIKAPWQCEVLERDVSSEQDPKPEPRVTPEMKAGLGWKGTK